MNDITLVDIAHVIMGQSPDGSTYNKLGIGTPLLNGPAEFGEITPVAIQWTTAPARLSAAGDILFCVRGNTLGRQNTADREYAIGRGLAAIRARKDKAHTGFVGLWLRYKAASLLAAGNGSTFPSVSGEFLESLPFPVAGKTEQRKIAEHLNSQLDDVEKARQAARAQLREISKLADAIIFDSIKHSKSTTQSLGNMLEEVKKGIGKTWAEYPVLGATRRGLAPAKEQPGKQAPKYKPAFPGTVFYNPMRILIGSIAFVDVDDTAGITSPDYVALKGKEGVVDSRWFYYWLRSPLGEQCILSLARGAVRERMLFNRLAEGEIELPSFTEQQKASKALKELRPIRSAIEQKLSEIDLLPQKILAQAFEN
ncbi:MAG: restriction endonuclease subunit S [Burkholderiaceae bacterium]